MKKLALIICFLAAVGSANAQDKKVRLGLKLYPSLAWNRANIPSNLDVTKMGIKPKFGLGVIVDYYLGDNYALGFGANYTTKGVGFSFNTNPLGKGEIKYSLQYVELPVTLKLFTNEISDDMVLYFQLGGSINVNIQSKATYSFTNPGSGPLTSVTFDETGSGNKIFRPELSGVISAGVEKNMSASTTIVIGATYNRGLTNIIRANKGYLASYGLDGLKILNDYIGIDVGLKF